MEHLLNINDTMKMPLHKQSSLWLRMHAQAVNCSHTTPFDRLVAEDKLSIVAGLSGNRLHQLHGRHG